MELRDGNYELFKGLIIFYILNNCIAYIMKQNVSIDIDTIDDFDFALLRISNSTNQKIKKNH